jgi:hypothetical protein
MDSGISISLSGRIIIESGVLAKRVDTETLIHIVIKRPGRISFSFKDFPAAHTKDKTPLKQKDRPFLTAFRELPELIY